VQTHAGVQVCRDCGVGRCWLQTVQAGLIQLWELSGGLDGADCILSGPPACLITYLGLFVLPCTSHILRRRACAGERGGGGQVRSYNLLAPSCPCAQDDGGPPGGMARDMDTAGKVRKQKQARLALPCILRLHLHLEMVGWMGGAQGSKNRAAGKKKKNKRKKRKRKSKEKQAKKESKRKESTHNRRHGAGSSVCLSYRRADGCWRM
jgi:hypothetical protein